MSSGGGQDSPRAVERVHGHYEVAGQVDEEREKAQVYVPTRSFKDCMPTAGDANFVKPAILLPGDYKSKQDKLE